MSRLLKYRKKIIGGKMYLTDLYLKIRMVQDLIGLIYIREIERSRFFFYQIFYQTEKWIENIRDHIDTKHYQTLNNHYIQMLGLTKFQENYGLFQASSRELKHLYIQLMVSRFR